MRSTTHQFRSAVTPVLAAVLLLVAAICWAAAGYEGPRDSAELHAHVQALQAEAAEAELIGSMSMRPAASVFARVHAIQLGHRVEATRGDLETLEANVAPTEHVVRARQIAGQLADRVQTLTMPPAAQTVPVPVSLAHRDGSLLDALRDLERELR